MMGVNNLVKIIHVVGARPNFMKVSPLFSALSSLPNVEQMLIHTGQHYDANMSEVFFTELGLRRPDINLDVRSGSHGMQTAQIIQKFEEVVITKTPDLVLVYGDVNSTVAAALVCAKLGFRIGHVEAGLRSFDRSMPEEINRVLTDQMADMLFTPSADGDKNLLREGIAGDKIHMVGNVMIDTLIRLLPIATQCPIDKRLEITKGQYGIVTLHRPSNVDDPLTMRSILKVLTDVGRSLPLLFPVHPRTRARIMQFDSSVLNTGHLRFIEPLGYIEFLKLQMAASIVITDSGGIQEETTYLGIPCITIRENTERPITVQMGTNTLVGLNMGKLRTEIFRVLDGGGKQGQVPPFWDGMASNRIVDVITKYL